MFLSPPSLTGYLEYRKPPPPRTLTLGERKGRRFSSRAMSVNLQAHAFAGNPLRSHHHGKSDGPCSYSSALETLNSLLLGDFGEGSSSDFKVLPFRKGRPLARSSESAVSSGSSPPVWHLGWLGPSHFKEFSADSFVYLGPGLSDETNTVYWTIDVSAAAAVGFGNGDGSYFVELRTLMVATDWANERMMGELAIAGHAKALLEWHNTSRFCGDCGARAVPIDAGRKKQCTSESCKKRVYPRVDPVVIMLVIDKANDRALLSRQSRFVPRMWSCLAGFIEPGESLEEAVRRETWEETGIEVEEVVYHSSQPWPVVPSSLPCQLMVGFFAYAKSLDIHMNKELEDLAVKSGCLLSDAQWHSREDVKEALTFAEYEKAQRTAAVRVEQMCKGVEKGQNFSADFNVESGELATMFIPGPFAIAHHLISSWVNQGASNNGFELPSKQSRSFSSL